MATDFSYYDLLGITSDASDQDIKDAYRAASRRYHPDVNSAPNAVRLTQMLNEAYETLGNSERRRTYDNSRKTDAMQPNATAASEPNKFQLLACDRCKRIHPQLRYVRFYRVWSIVVYAQSHPVEGTFCPSCRSRIAATTALFSALLGLWAFPLGFIFALRAIIVAATGGITPKAINASLLQHQGSAYFLQNKLIESLTAFRDSLRFKNDTDVQNILAYPHFDGVRSLPKTGWLRGQTIAIVSLFIPIILLIAFVLTFADHSAAPTTGSHTTT